MWKQLMNSAVVAPLGVHPAKVGIMEAVRWIEEPISPADLQQLFAGEIEPAVLDYHVRTLRPAVVSVAIDKPRKSYAQA
jgi:hypothetical protein